jgi:uncharacterized damage-inducible protein DinB
MEEHEVLIRNLSDAPTVIEGLLASMQDVDLNLVRRPGAWSVAEHLNHLADAQPMLLGRLKQFVYEERPRIKPYFPAEAPNRSVSRTVADAIRSHREVREEQVRVLEALEPAVWVRSAEHPEYTSYTFAIFVRHILMHDYWHMYRMEELAFTSDRFLTDLS